MRMVRSASNPLSGRNKRRLLLRDQSTIGMAPRAKPKAVGSKALFDFLVYPVFPLGKISLDATYPSKVSMVRETDPHNGE